MDNIGKSDSHSPTQDSCHLDSDQVNKLHFLQRLLTRSELAQEHKIVLLDDRKQ